MNRPKLEDYKLKNEWEYSGKYVTDLEQYCDALEVDKKKLRGYANVLEQKICGLQETYCDALDKACEILEFNDKSGYCYKPKTKEQWKEWLMEDEKTDNQ